jgi:hypothetical protein
MPFSVDLHFGYRNSAWTSQEMDVKVTTDALQLACSEFDSKFGNTFVNSDTWT